MPSPRTVDGQVGGVTDAVKNARTLRVFFGVGQERPFKPGMFADVRSAPTARHGSVPTAAVLHVGKFDYVFAE